MTADTLRIEATTDAQLGPSSDDDVMPCGCCSGSCYCDGDEALEEMIGAAAWEDRWVPALADFEAKP